MGSFEDIVIFVTDMERALESLNPLEKKLLAMNVLEEYTVDEVARLLGYHPKTIRRLLAEALDELSQILLAVGLLDRLPSAGRGREKCQGGKNYNFNVTNSNKTEYKYRKYVQSPPSDLIS
jgi:hypothetical protein